MTNDYELTPAELKMTPAQFIAATLAEQAAIDRARADLNVCHQLIAARGLSVPEQEQDQ